jgi:hypothetical protein
MDRALKDVKKLKNRTSLMPISTQVTDAELDEPKKALAKCESFRQLRPHLQQAE